MLFLILAILHCAFATPVERCPSGPLPQAVQINDCTKPPCVLKHGTNVSLEIQFEVPQDTDNMRVAAKAFSLGAVVNYQLPDDNVCHSLKDGECPLDAGEVVTYFLNLPISSAFPSVPVVIDFSLLSGPNITCCFSISCQVE